MRAETMTRPKWLARVLLVRHVSTRCDSVSFKAVGLRSFDSLLGLLALHPVRFALCGRRYYWLSMRGAQ